MILRTEDVKHIHSKYLFLQRYFPNNTARKNYFLATCSHLDPTVDLEFVNDTCPFGGVIGIGNSWLEPCFNWSKVFRLHASLHDAAGYIKGNRSLGPGYSYAIHCKISCCLVGHLSGIPFCLYMKLFKRDTFKRLEC